MAEVESPGNLGLVMYSHPSYNIPLNVIQQDVDFLKQSWVNMDEMEQTQDSELHIDEDIEVLDPPFQPVVSKYQKKNLKKPARPTSSYHTRTKVGASNSSLSWNVFTGT